MNIDQYKHFLLTHLPNAKLASGGREVNCKCMYCDDQHAHMYVKIPQTPNEASFYNCFRCPAQGIVTPDTLNEWNCYTDDMAVALINHNKNIKYVPITGTRDVRNLNWSYVSNIDFAMPKLMYINQRLGLRNSISEFSNLKVCYNLKDILISNNIQELTRSPEDVEILNQYFVGFISLDNSFINLRRIVPKGIVPERLDKRYVNYNLFNKYDNTERFYTIPVTINVNSPERIKLHIAEGPLDCLSIYYNLRDKEPGIYTAIAGNNYQGIVRHFILALGFHHLEIHLYPDNDKSGDDRKMRSVVDLCDPLGVPVFIHRKYVSVIIVMDCDSFGYHNSFYFEETELE